MKIAFILFLLSLSGHQVMAQDQSRTEIFIVKSLSYEAEKKMYRLHIAGKAGAYFASKSEIECLKHSISKKVGVQVTYNIKSLAASSCKVLD